MNKRIIPNPIIAGTCIENWLKTSLNGISSLKQVLCLAKVMFNIVLLSYKLYRRIVENLQVMFNIVP